MPLTAVSTTVTPGTAGTKKFPKFSDRELGFAGCEENWPWDLTENLPQRVDLHSDC